MELFIACPRGFEELLADELAALGAVDSRLTIAGAYVEGDLEFAYRTCLWSRLANRVLLPLARYEVTDARQLYTGARGVEWTQHMSPEQSFAIDFSGTDRNIRHTRFGAQTIKDAIVDSMLDKVGRRPNIELHQPDILFNARLAKGKCVLSLDLSGGSLHRRGYRREMVPAPLKENLAAALLIRAGWPAISNPENALIDPMCGSGTLLIEAAMMSADIAPGLKRDQFGFEKWLQHDAGLWTSLRYGASERRNHGLAGPLPEIRGYDKDTRAVQAAQTNIEVMGLEKWLRVSARPVEALKKPTHRPIAEGLIITNPPYGERWGEVEGLSSVYQTLGERLKAEFPGWQFAAFTGNLELAGELKLRTKKKYQLLNGQIASQLLLYDLKKQSTVSPEDGRQQQPKALSDNAQMLLNRLRKNQRKLKPWLKREGVSCYRLYDSDLPEYAVAIDVYEQTIHIQEYAPPDTIENHIANRRLSEVKQALITCFPDASERLYVKQRRKQKGTDQYQRRDNNRHTVVQTVSEGPAKLEINLTDYLDTGLFLDHRPIRKVIAEMATGKRLLNLFCYTAAVTVQAAIGGAGGSLSIDMSNRYLEWARRNFQLNGIDEEQHQLLRADCLDWLETAKQQYSGSFDVIFFDPPTFSNSKKMASVLDIQRDHSQLIDQAMLLLAPKGVLFFSNNFRRFKMDSEVLECYQVSNITQETIPPDFARNTKIHNCWRITHDR